MVYSGGSVGVGVKGDGDNESSGGIGGQDVKTGKVKEAVLLLLLLLYPNDDISVCDNKLSSCSAYTPY